MSNVDPGMLVLCALRLSLIEESETTRVLFARPTVMAADSPARNKLGQTENDVIGIIRNSLGQASIRLPG